MSEQTLSLHTLRSDSALWRRILVSETALFVRLLRTGLPPAARP